MHFAVLGSHPELSLAELAAVTKQRPAVFAGKVALFDDLGAREDALMTKLGGMQKVGTVIAEVHERDIETLAPLFVAMLREQRTEQKCVFGVSVYDFGNTDRVPLIARRVHRLGMTVKRLLREDGMHGRFLTTKEDALNAIAITKNHLLTTGAEFVLLVAPERVVVGMTSALQDAEAWSKRDFGRPRRNAKQGMLPPKLARIMLNLTGVPLTGKTMLDPFCGSGTVLMEAALLGAAKVIGGDKNAQAIADTRANLSWLTKSGIPMPDANLHVALTRDLTLHVPTESIDVLVTETALGPPRKGSETAGDIAHVLEDLAILYRESFDALRVLLKPGAVVVIAAPVHFVDRASFHLPVAEIMTAIGYCAEPWKEVPLIYRREGQYVGREFFRFTRRA